MFVFLTCKPECLKSTEFILGSIHVHIRPWDNCSFFSQRFWGEWLLIFSQISKYQLKSLFFVIDVKCRPWTCPASEWEKGLTDLKLHKHCLACSSCPAASWVWDWTDSPKWEEQAPHRKLTSWRSQWQLFQTECNIITKDFARGCGWNSASPVTWRQRICPSVSWCALLLQQRSQSGVCSLLWVRCSLISDYVIESLYFSLSECSGGSVLKQNLKKFNEWWLLFF